MRYVYIGFFSFCVLLASMFWLPSQAVASSRTYTVTVDDLKVRTQPTTEAEIVGTLRNGETVNAFSDQDGWVQTYWNGQKAWVSGKFLAADSPSTSNQERSAAAEKNAASITAKDARLRSGPSTDYDMIGSLAQGETVRILNTKGDWHQIKMASGQTGWVAAWLTDHPVSRAEAKSPNDTIKPEQNQEAVQTEETAGTLNGRIIVVDAGHGGHDPGAIGIEGVAEKKVTLATANAIAGKLRAYGANVIMTRTDDSYLPLESRVAISRRNQADAFISIHYNAYPVDAVNGFSTHYFTNGEDRQLASAIQKELSKRLPLYSRGSMQDNYYVLRSNPNLSVLLELGFITNPNDYLHIQTDSYRSQAAEGIAQALIQHFQ